MRPVQFFQTGNMYHVYNRGVDKRIVFRFRHQYVRFVETIHNIVTTGSATKPTKKIQSLALKKIPPKISILAWCLMPNHYHFLMKQLEDNGITDFMHKLDTSYTKYFNLNSDKRTGRLFENTFKAKMIDSDEQLLHTHRYIHLNPLIAHVVDNLESYKWSSYLDFIGKRNGTLCQKDEILNFFTKNPPQEYQNFVNDQINYAFLLKQIDFKKDEDSLFL
jgi:putative transposase